MYFFQWTGILLRLAGDIKGMRVKIENSHRIKEHFTVSAWPPFLPQPPCLVYLPQKALAIRPNSPDVGHLLGRWYVTKCEGHSAPSLNVKNCTPMITVVM